MRQVPAKFTDVHILEDVHMLLGVIEAGFDVAVTRRFFGSLDIHDGSDQVTGNATNPTLTSGLKVVRDAIHHMVSLHSPDLVHLVETSGGMRTRDGTPSGLHPKITMQKYLRANGRTLPRKPRT
jgi:hypothetical protein